MDDPLITPKKIIDVTSTSPLDKTPLAPPMASPWTPSPTIEKSQSKLSSTNDYYRFDNKTPMRTPKRKLYKSPATHFDSNEGKNKITSTPTM